MKQPIITNTKFRFFVVGGINNLMAFILYLGFLKFGFSIGVALGVSTAAGFITSFLLMGTFVFNGISVGKLLASLFCSTAIYGINLVLILFVQSFGLNAAASQLICLPFVAFASYVVNKQIVYRKVVPEETNE